ncbi:hypothetical protein LAT59_04375, partial [Candidatus Gracilibacteria bacterium]|nr:hypothetical protein [Candidatus Gracilibacteria bacterium]
NGSENLRNIRLIDERAPACATADGTFVDLQNKRFTNKLGEVIDIFPSGQGNHNNSILEVGEEFFYTCARDNTLEDYINIVEVIGTGVTSGETVRDDDNTEVLVSTDDEESACIGLTASPRSAQTSLTSTLTCTGSNATSFRIEVRNPSGDIVNTINNATGQVTLPLIGNSNTNYTASCFVNNETTAIPACQTTLTVTRGGGGGGGADFACNEIIRNGNSYRCIGTGGQMNQFGIVYNIPGESEKQSQVASAQNLTSFQGRRFADFTLPAGATNAQCYSANVGDTTRVGIGDTWRTSLACEYRPGGGGGGGPICGDGIINQPTEECDLGPLNGQPGSTCTADCKIVRTTPIPQCKDLPDSIRSQICGIETIPGESVYSFGPSGTVIIGHGRNPLYELRGIPSFKNNSIHDVAFDKICVSSDPNSGTQNPLIINDGSLTNQEICVDIEGRKIYPYEEIFIVRQGNNYVVRNQYSNITRDDQGIYPVFLGDKDGIPASARDYGTANVRTSVYSRIQNNQGNLQSFSFYHTFLSGNVNVRVARPAVSTVGGGTSFVKSTTTSDVAQVTQGIGSIINNTNFVGTSVSSSGVSSDAGVVTDTDASSGDSDMQSGTDVITQTTPTTNFESYNDLDNVFIKSGPHTFSGTPSGNGARTYIIENGDVTISGNITSSDNIAIIVRNGTINIKSNVTQVNATLMILGNGIITGEATDKQLRVNGALYGNIDQLIANRYYIDGSGSSLSVGTIVSFGSNLLRRPAPLLSQFVGEYLDSQRVAR